MKKTDMFFTEFSKHIFCAIAEIFLDSERVILHYSKECEDISGDTLTISEALELLNGRIVIDTGNVGRINIAELKKIYSESASKKSYFFSANVKPNIVKRFVLTLYPVHGKNKLYASVCESESAENTITFISRKNLLNFDLSDIIYIGYGNHCVRVFTSNGCTNMFNISFSDAADMLLRHCNFTRSYKNCIINMDKVIRIENDSFIMSNNDIISIPKRRLNEIKNIYQEYIITKTDYNRR